MNKTLHYITFQYFPHFSANTIVTMKTIKYLKKLGMDVKLIFPGREKENITNEDILSFYNICENIDIVKTSYWLPFGKLKFLEKYFYVFSHFIWSLSIFIKYIFSNQNLKNILFYTRSNWVFYFFSIINLKIIYECHKYSKSTNFILTLTKNKKYSGYVFQNILLAQSFKLSATQNSNLVIMPSAFDEDDFLNLTKPKIEKDVVFIGRFTRFNENRNLTFLIDAFSNKNISNFNLNLIGGPRKIADELREEIKIKKVGNVKVSDYLPQKDLNAVLASSSIGILINSSKDIHSKLHTSPVKYFEYIRSGLKVLAVDFEAHRLLPYSKNIYFFKEGDVADFIDKLTNAAKDDDVKYDNIQQFSYSKRIEAIVNLFARLEGLEPPTL